MEPTEHARSNRGLWRILAVTLLMAVAAGGVVASRGRLTGSNAAGERGTAVPTAAATVSRTTVVERQQMPGTLGYAGSYIVVRPAAGGAADQQGGVITRLPTPGTVMRRGQAVYEVDGRPVPVWYSARPAWRDFRLGMTDGTDVRELEANLVALGHDPGRDITVDRHFSPSTAAAVRRWQRATGHAGTGSLRVGEVVFLPGEVRVTAVSATVGARVQPEAPILTASSTRAVVTAELHPSYGRLIRPGSRVEVTLPEGENTPGTVLEVSRAAVVPGSSGGGRDSGGGGNGGSDPEQAMLPVTIALADPKAARGLDQAPVRVAVTTQQRRGVLAVPINALLAAAGSGYEVELVDGDARTRVPVRTGLFDETAGLVEVTGPGLMEGAKVEVPAP